MLTSPRILYHREVENRATGDLLAMHLQGAMELINALGTAWIPVLQYTHVLSPMMPQYPRKSVAIKQAEETAIP